MHTRSKNPFGKLSSGLLILGLVALGSAPDAAAGRRDAGSGEHIDGDVVSTGGGVATDGTYTLVSVIGQGAVGVSQGSGAGIWYHGVLSPDAGALPGEGEGEGEGEPDGFIAFILGDNPVDLNVGDDYTFTLQVSGETGSLGYQWYFDPGSKVLDQIPGEAGPTLTLTNVVPESAGFYLCEVSDDLETISTPPVELIVSSQLPLGGSLMLAVLALLAALAATWRQRHHRSRA